MSEHIRSFLSAALLMGTSACATMPDRSTAIAEYTRSLAVTDLLDVGECRTIDEPDVEGFPNRATLRQEFRSEGFSQTETRAAYAYYRFLCALGEGELSRTRIQIPEDLDSEPE